MAYSNHTGLFCRSHLGVVTQRELGSPGRTSFGRIRRAAGADLGRRDLGVGDADVPDSVGESGSRTIAGWAL